jgi:hypothetical protein
MYQPQSLDLAQAGRPLGPRRECWRIVCTFKSEVYTKDQVERHGCGILVGHGKILKGVLVISGYGLEMFGIISE